MALKEGPRPLNFAASAFSAQTSSPWERNRIVEKQEEVCSVFPTTLHLLQAHTSSLYLGLGSQEGKGVGGGSWCPVPCALFCSNGHHLHFGLV